ncbi:MAG TPA: LuxR C-terminal-related transcriptional regulator [Rhizomicrobium sp.]|jgi:DNA-binding CsgD family transcriptional regulator/catechol 2,3-dioxygenase-like lactoylglutathione lyase family enzyme|nr:LuxR C-terminal-related transcriptional regulator [Rhizomicrobium sp.]
MSKRGRPAHDDLLTPAEWRVVEAVRHGMSNRDIAIRRGISLDAVKFHVTNALEKLGLKNRTALRHWSGIAKSSALYSREVEMEALQLGPVGQISRKVKDINAARQWYGEALGLKHLYSFGDLAFFDCGGTRLFLSQAEGGEGDSILYFRVPDIRGAHVELAAKGIEFLQAPHMIHRHEDGTEEWMAFFKDNDGRPLAIMSQAKPVAEG